jgi:hypothetical protein
MSKRSHQRYHVVYYNIGPFPFEKEPYYIEYPTAIRDMLKQLYAILPNNDKAAV